MIFSLLRPNSMSSAARRQTARRDGVRSRIGLFPGDEAFGADQIGAVSPQAVKHALQSGRIGDRPLQNRLVAYTEKGHVRQFRRTPRVQRPLHANGALIAWVACVESMKCRSGCLLCCGLHGSDLLRLRWLPLS